MSLSTTITTTCRYDEPQGYSGFTGLVGHTGYSGATGMSGYSGWSGHVDPIGPPGQSEAAFRRDKIFQRTEKLVVTVERGGTSLPEKILDFIKKIFGKSKY